tara:strand:- start:39 stop:221 length:183 start_codon:yes stop_codon:yes gene_type:complete
LSGGAVNLKNSKVFLMIDENFFSDTDFIACIGIINSEMELSLYKTPSEIGIKNLRTLLFL